MKGEIKKEEET